MSWESDMQGRMLTGAFSSKVLRSRAAECTDLAGSVRDQRIQDRLRLLAIDFEEMAVRADQQPVRDPKGLRKTN